MTNATDLGTGLDEGLEVGLLDALRALRDGDARQAQRALSEAGDSLLGIALGRHLDRQGAATVYDQPAAFEAFIRGGGNVRLYRHTGAALASLYREHHAMSLLDIGCGDGLALLSALEQGGADIVRLDVIEPSNALRSAALRTLSAHPGDAWDVHAWSMDLQTFVERLPPGAHWSLAQATFALQAIAPDERVASLAKLRDRVDRLAIVEFDVPDLDPGSEAYLLSLAHRYERALSEYDADRELVAQGFLMPMLLGQLDASRPAHNWEHPFEQWVGQLKQAGFAQVEVRDVDDYFWAPARLLVAS